MTRSRPGRLTTIYLDVDGVLLPFGGPPSQAVKAAGANPLLARLDLGLAQALAELPAELVWATTWMDEANDSLGPLLGWPRLPVLAAGEPSPVDDYFGLHWKTRPILETAAGEPFAWVDDEITDEDQEWVNEHHHGPALLLRVDPQVGLTTADLARLTTWLAHPGDE